ncbi:MAG: hypothetical protein U0163_14615 [Gemmatimonadaceae bacterium]
MAELVTIAIGRAALMLISLLNVRLYTSYLSHDEVGRLALISGTATILSLLIDRSASAFWYRMVRPWSRAGLGHGRLAGLLLGTATMAILLGAGVSLIARTIGLGTPITWPWLALTCAVGVFFNSAYNALLGSINVLGERRWFVALGVTGSGLGLLLAIRFAHVDPRAEWWMLGTIVGQATLFPVLLIKTRQSMSRLHDHHGTVASTLRQTVSLRAWMHFAMPALVAAILYAAQMLGYRYVLNAVAGASQVALFTVGFGIGVAIMNAFEYFATQFLMPHFLAGVETFDAARMAAAWNRYARAIIPATVLVGMFAATGGPFLVRVLAAPSFAAAGPLVAWGVAADALRLVTQSMALVCQARLQMRHVLLPAVAGVLTSLGGIVWLARDHPMVGTGEALVLGAVVWLLLQVRSARRLLPIRLPWRVLVAAAGVGLPLVVAGQFATHAPITMSSSLFALAVGAAYVVLVGQADWSRLPDGHEPPRRASSAPDRGCHRRESPHRPAMTPRLKHHGIPDQVRPRSPS